MKAWRGIGLAVLLLGGCATPSPQSSPSPPLSGAMPAKPTNAIAAAASLVPPPPLPAPQFTVGRPPPNTNHFNYPQYDGERVVFILSTAGATNYQIQRTTNYLTWQVVTNIPAIPQPKENFVLTNMHAQYPHAQYRLESQR